MTTELTVTLVSLALFLSALYYLHLQDRGGPGSPT